MNFENILYMFFADPRVRTVAGLIILDVVLAIASAIKYGEFNWVMVPHFYQTMVLPYILGYLAAYAASFLIVGDLLNGWAFQGVVSALWLAIISNLVGSIVGHLKDLQVPAE